MADQGNPADAIRAEAERIAGEFAFRYEREPEPVYVRTQLVIRLDRGDDFWVDLPYDPVEYDGYVKMSGKARVKLTEGAAVQGGVLTSVFRHADPTHWMVDDGEG